ncbi:MAG: calcium-binding protein [Nitrospirales bacterium]
MAISSELMYAILAMDSYNRGYNPGIKVLGGVSSSIGDTIGNATVISEDRSSEAQDAGFYGLAYQWNGDTIISYRGTDNLVSPPWTDDPAGGSDIWNGYSTGAGSGISEQARLAAEFYQAVTSTENSDPRNGSAKLTGHSLGGGLAGFIGALYGKEAVVFANMPFEGAAESNADQASTGGALSDALREDFYNNVGPYEVQIGNNLSGYAVTGEFLAPFRIFQDTPVTYLDSHAGFEYSNNLHSQALLIALMFAQENGHDDWFSIGDELNTALFNREIAAQAGFNPAGQDGHYDEELKQLSAIAYSSLEGSTGLVFGNTGIRALFDDANELGRLKTEGNDPGGFTNTQESLVESIVQSAGQMALGKVLFNSQSVKHPQLGFLTVEGEGRLLKADLTEGLWTLNDPDGENTNTVVKVKGIQAMLDPFFASDPAAAVLLASMQRLYGNAETHDSSVINRIDFALGTGALDVTLSEPEPNSETSNSSKTGLFVGLATADQVKGNKDNNMLLGRGQNDHLYGQEGKDILLGGAGNDTLIGGSGDDVLHGGESMSGASTDGIDTADYSEGDHGALTPGAITVRLDLGSGAAILDKHPVWIENDGYGSKDYLYSIEKIVATAQNDTVVINGSNSVLQAGSYAWTGGTLEIDGGGGEDTLDFSQFTGSLQIPSLVNGAGQAGNVSFTNFEHVDDSEGASQVGNGAWGALPFFESAYEAIAGVQTIFGNGGDDKLVVGPDGVKIDGGAGNDVLVALSASNALLDGSSGDDIILSFGGQNNVIHGGGGQDIIFSLTPGTRITGGDEVDTFYFGNNLYIEDATPEDQIVAFGLPLWGGIRWEESEDPWAYGAFFFRYGKNQAGDLVIENAFGNSLGWDGTFVANPNVDPTTPLSERTAGLLVFEYEMERILLVNNDTGKGLYEFFQLVFGYMYKALLGVSLFEGVDPLVLDLDGDGLELTARTNLSPVFDLDGDGFAEQTGWVRPDDGLLAYDQNANGQIDDIGELFGNPTTSGFAELAAHDGNADGVINAQDAIFADLRVWSRAA